MAEYLQPLRYYPTDWSVDIDTEPTVEPVTVAEAKTHARVTGSDDDTYISGLIKAAREQVEVDTGRAIITQTRVLKINKFPRLDSQYIALPGGQLQSVSSIYYTDTDGNSTLWSSSNYAVETNVHPGRINLAYGQSWPSVREIGLPITITYVAGYPGDGASPEDLTANVPESIKTAIYLLVAFWYDNRHAVSEINMSIVPLGYRKILEAYRNEWAYI